MYIILILSLFYNSFHDNSVNFYFMILLTTHIKGMYIISVVQISASAYSNVHALAHTHVQGMFDNWCLLFTLDHFCSKKKDSASEYDWLIYLPLYLFWLSASASSAEQGSSFSSAAGCRKKSCSLKRALFRSSCRSSQKVWFVS